MTEVAAADAPSLAQNAIKTAIDIADDAIASNDDDEKVAAYKTLQAVINSAAAFVSLDAAKCDKVERLVQTLHLSALAAEVDEAAKAASRAEMEQLRATILRMKASTPSTAAAPPTAAPRTEPAAAAPAAVAPPSSEPAAAAPASLTAAAASSSGQRTGNWTDEEVEYARKIVAQFESGLLPASFKGRKLNSVLQEALTCAQGRVTKKLKKEFGGGSRKNYVVKASESELEAAAKELATLEAAYITSLAPKPPKAPKAPKEPKPGFKALLRAITTPFACDDAALVAAISKAESVARGDDVQAQADTLADTFESLSCAVLVADPAQVRLDAAASRLLLLVAEVLCEKARKAANSKHGDSLSKNMIKLRKKIAQLGPQAPGAVEAANQRLVAALNVARPALGADDATKATAFDALRKAITQAEYKASLDAKTHDDLLQVATELFAAKTYRASDSFRRTKKQLASDIKALCPALANTGPAPRRQRDAASALTVPKEAFSDGAFDQHYLDINTDAPTTQRAKAGTAVTDLLDAQQRESLRQMERWAGVAASDDERSPEQQAAACDEMQRTLLNEVRAEIERYPTETRILYIGSAVVRRILYSDGSIADEPLGWLGRNECVVVCAKTGRLLSVEQINALIEGDALKVFVSTHDRCGAVVDIGERQTQVAGRLYAAQAVAEIILGYGYTTPGGVARMLELCALYATLISLEKAALVGVPLHVVEVSPLTTPRALAVVTGIPTFLGKPRGNVQAALRIAVAAVQSTSARAGDVVVLCLSRPPVYQSSRETWSSWAGVRVGHFVFIFWFVEGGQVYVKRSNFCEGGEVPADAYYERVCRSKLYGPKFRVEVEALPMMDIDGPGGAAVAVPAETNVDTFLEDDTSLVDEAQDLPLDANALLMDASQVDALAGELLEVPSQLVDNVAPQRPRTRSRAGLLPSTAAAPAEVEAAPDDVDDDRMYTELAEAWAAAPPEDVVFDEVDVTDQANKMSEDALREALAHASRESRGEKPALVARFVDLQRSLAAREVIPVDDFAPLVETPEEAPRTPLAKRRRLQPTVAAPLPPGWAFGAGLDVDLKLSGIAGTTTSPVTSALLGTTVPAAASGLASLGPAAAVPSPGWGSFAA